MQRFLKELKANKKEQIFLLGLFLCALLSIALRLRYLSFPLTVDEGAYAYITYFWNHGKKLYTDVWLDRPQGIFVIYSIIFKTTGYSTEAIRLFAAFYNALSVIFIGLLSRKLFSVKVSILAALIYAFFSCGLAIEGFTANAEIFIVLPIVISAYLLVLGDKLSRRRLLYFFASGILAGFALSVKMSGVSAIILAIFYILMSYKFLLAAKNILILLFGFFVSLLPFILHGLFLGFKNYLWAVLGWRIFEYSPFSHTLQSHFVDFYESARIVFPEIAFLLLLLLFWFFKVFLKRKDERGFLFLFLLTSFLGVALGGTWYRHYYSQMIAPLSIVSAVVIALVIAESRKKPYQFLVFAYLGIIGLLFFLFINVRPYILNNSLLDDYVYNDNETKYSLNDKVTDYIVNKTNMDDSIYIFFSQANIYFSTKRMPTYSQTFVAHILSDKSFESNMNKILESVEAPKYLIIYKNRERLLENFPTIRPTINKRYFLESEFDGVQFYRRIDVGLLR